MLDWAKREIELAKKKEVEDSSIDEIQGFDYAGACYDSAFKAFESLVGDNHSGFSIALTKGVLNRLIEGKTLTPIEDTPDIWNEVSGDTEMTLYQCRRMSSLFKYVYQDGEIKYSDINSSYCVDIESQATWHSSLIQTIVDTMFPISMPYIAPTKPIPIYCMEFLTDKKNGDIDTLGILYLINHDGQRVDICKYFKEELNGWIEIDADEYNNRYNIRINQEAGA